MSEKTFFLVVFTLAAARAHTQRDASHPISPHTLIHLPPPCTPPLPPTTHHLLHLIITPSTSPLLLPWQQQCWAQVPVLPVVTSLPLTTTIYYIKIKPTSFKKKKNIADGHRFCYNSEEAVIFSQAKAWIISSRIRSFLLKGDNDCEL